MVRRSCNRFVWISGSQKKKKNIKVCDPYSSPRAVSCSLGGSCNGTIDRACSITYVWAYRLRCKPWFEFVKSEANWSDGASRDLLEDSFSADNGFVLKKGWFARELWTMSLPEVWRFSCKL